MTRKITRAAGTICANRTLVAIELFERVGSDAVRCNVCDCEIGMSRGEGVATVESHRRSAGHQRGVGQLERFGHTVSRNTITFKRSRK